MINERTLWQAERMDNRELVRGSLIVGLKGSERVYRIQPLETYMFAQYADPPYLEGTRKGKVYRHEMMSPEGHLELLDALLAHQGAVILSGYDSDLYNDKLAGWNKSYMAARANSGGERTEVIWFNFEIERLGLYEKQPPSFGRPYPADVL